MYHIQTLNKISAAGLKRFDPEHYQVSDSQTNPEGIMVRSAKLLDMDFPSELLAIARAGVGVNNIPIERCSEAGIAVFSTPGANANAVKELVLCAMLIGSRDIPGALNWVREQAASGVEVSTVVEKGKSAFVGPRDLPQDARCRGSRRDRLPRRQRRHPARHGRVRLRSVPVRRRRPAP